MKISETENEVNDFMIEAGVLFNKMPKDKYIAIIEPTKIKLNEMIRLSKDFGEEIKTKMDVYREIMQSCQQTKLSKEDIPFELSKYLIAFNELSNE